MYLRSRRAAAKEKKETNTSKVDGLAGDMAARLKEQRRNGLGTVSGSLVY
jgi:hypothetical protein